MQVPAFYFDGKSSRRHTVTLQVENGLASLSGDIERECPVVELRVSERLSRAARKVTFPDGAYLEIRDNTVFAALLQASAHRDSLVVRMQQNWRATLAAAAVLIALLAAGYIYLLPGVAGLIARSLPLRIEQRIGDGGLRFLDAHVLLPTQLPAAQRQAITTRFRALTAEVEGVPHYQLLFRKSLIGPNALALPSGQIVLTDDMVTLLNDDDAVMGVLAHELGHVHRHHAMRRLIQSSTIGAAATVLFGDVSAVIANVPTVLLDMKYSRDAEREADDYALALFKANGISAQKLAFVFRKLGEKDADGKGMPRYLSSHPANAERVQRILDAS